MQMVTISTAEHSTKSRSHYSIRLRVQLDGDDLDTLNNKKGHPSGGSNQHSELHCISHSQKMYANHK